MRNGYRVVDIDTHVNPSYETLVRYLDPSARSRVDEFRPFVRTRSSDGITTRVLHVAPYPFDRFPGEAPYEAMVVAGSKGALEGRVTRSSSHHRVPPADGVQDENVAGRIKDMDSEGRDVDFLIPGTLGHGGEGAARHHPDRGALSLLSQLHCCLLPVLSRPPQEHDPGAGR
jgi:hypothetical protein